MPLLFHTRLQALNHWRRRLDPVLITGAAIGLVLLAGCESSSWTSARASGVTTVLGAVRISADKEKGGSMWRRDGVELGRRYEVPAGVAKARHLMHVRWDPNFMPAEDKIAALKTFSTVGNIVYNENIPGQRQNYCRGGSHCGNLSAVEAIDRDLVDVLCSDYHFPSLLGSVVKLLAAGMRPHEAVNPVTRNAARALQREQQFGAIEVGKLADLALFVDRGQLRRGHPHPGQRRMRLREPHLRIRQAGSARGLTRVLVDRAQHQSAHRQQPDEECRGG